MSRMATMITLYKAIWWINKTITSCCAFIIRYTPSMCKNIAISPPLSKQSKFRNLDLSSLKFTPVTSSQEARLFQSYPNYIYPKKTFNWCANYTFQNVSSSHSIKFRFHSLLPANLWLFYSIRLWYVCNFINLTFSKLIRTCISVTDLSAWRTCLKVTKQVSHVNYTQRKKNTPNITGFPIFSCRHIHFD